MARALFFIKGIMRKNHLAGLVAGLLGAAQSWFRGFFLSKGESDRRSAERLSAMEHEANESERLDRLRNPSDYQGR